MKHILYFWTTYLILLTFLLSNELIAYVAKLGDEIMWYYIGLQVYYIYSELYSGGKYIKDTFHSAKSVTHMQNK